jgi:hypothetical protein
VTTITEIDLHAASGATLDHAPGVDPVHRRLRKRALSMTQAQDDPAKDVARKIIEMFAPNELIFFEPMYDDYKSAPNDAPRRREDDGLDAIMYSRQRIGAGRSDSARSKSIFGLVRPMVYIESECRSSREFAHAAERDQAIEQPPAARGRSWRRGAPTDTRCHSAPSTIARLLTQPGPQSGRQAGQVGRHIRG